MRAGMSPEANAAAMAGDRLWQGHSAHGVTERWESLNDLLAADEGWEVWTGWYDARLRGDPVNPELEAARVLTPTEEDWEKGPAHVNAIIAGLIEEHLGRKFPAREILTVEDGEIALAPQELSNAERYQRICDQLSDTLEQFPEETLSNFYVDLRGPIEMLSHALRHRRDQPIIVHTRVRQAGREVAVLIEKDAYLRDDFKAQTLFQDLSEATIAIPSAVPAIAEEIAALKEEGMRVPAQEDRDAVLSAGQAVLEASAQEVRELIEPGLEELDSSEPGTEITDETAKERVYAVGWVLFRVPKLGAMVQRVVSGADQMTKLHGAINAATGLYQVLLRLFF